MLPYNELPVVLVSASDTAAANSFISELIDGEVRNEEVDTVDVENIDRIWQLKNKYYTAEVRLHPFTDNDTVPAAGTDCVEAYVLYLSAEETEHHANERWERIQRAGISPSVTILAGTWAEVPPALDCWAVEHHFEAVPLHEEKPPTTEESDDVAGTAFRESYGVQRVREALHTHAWRGLRRHRPVVADCGQFERDILSSSESEASDADGEEECVERAEAFALALGALGSARDQATDDASRRQRAEDLVAAFARALGLQLSDC